MKHVCSLLSFLLFALPCFSQEGVTRKYDEKTAGFTQKTPLSSSHIIKHDRYEFEVRNDPGHGKISVNTLRSDTLNPEEMSVKLFDSNGGVNEILLQKVELQNGLPGFSGSYKNKPSKPGAENSKYMGVELKFKVLK